MIKERDINLDIIRCLSVFLVICAHFLFNTTFYQTTITSRRMIFMTGIRTVLMCCVPLFLMLTGYLMCKKRKISISYYKGISHTAGIYVLASFGCILYKHIFWKQEVDFIYCVKEILGFTANGYAWYIEMYIGLFLLIPFLNILYHAIPERRGKRMLIATLLFVTVVPTAFNVFGAKILPEWWGGLWPLVYYYIGCYIHEYPPEISWKRNLAYICLAFILTIAFNIYRNYGKIYEYGVYNEWWGWITFLNSVLAFVFVKNLKTGALPTIVKKIITKISRLSLGMYLCSWMVDQYVYPIFNQYVPEMDDKLNYYPLIVVIVFLISFILAFIIDKIYNLIGYIIRIIYNCRGGKAYA